MNWMRVVARESHDGTPQVWGRAQLAGVLTLGSTSPDFVGLAQGHASFVAASVRGT